jgi:hypothetical protein
VELDILDTAETGIIESDFSVIDNEEVPEEHHIIEEMPEGDEEHKESSAPVEIEVDNLVSEVLTPEKETEEEEKADEVEISVEEKIELPGEPAEIQDYSVFSEVELVNALRDIINSDIDIDRHEEIEAIKAAFYRQQKAKTEQKRKDFIQAG